MTYWHGDKERRVAFVKLSGDRRLCVSKVREVLRSSARLKKQTDGTDKSVRMCLCRTPLPTIRAAGDSKSERTMISDSIKLSGTFKIGNITIHRLGYGAMQLTGPGVWGPPKDHAGAIRVLRRAVELGVDLVDTADSYGPYVAEELIREALHPYAKNLLIATKAGLVRTGPGNSLVPHRQRKARPARRAGRQGRQSRWCDARTNLPRLAAASLAGDAADSGDIECRASRRKLCGGRGEADGGPDGGFGRLTGAAATWIMRWRRVGGVAR
jgi:hypothetical protein